MLNVYSTLHDSTKLIWVRNSLYAKQCITNTHCIWGTIHLVSFLLSRLKEYLFGCVYSVFKCADDGWLCWCSQWNWKERRNAEKNNISCRHTCVITIDQSGDKRVALVDSRGETLMDWSDIEHSRFNGSLSAPQPSRLLLKWMRLFLPAFFPLGSYESYWIFGSSE